MGDWLDELNLSEDADAGPIVWWDREGHSYRMSGISNSHLSNIVALLERTSDSIAKLMFQGENAAFDIDREIENISERAAFFRHELEARKKTFGLP